MSGITSVGGLLPKDLLDRLASGDGLVGTKPVDYSLAPGERLSDAITRSWNRLIGLWGSFVAEEAALPESERAATGVTRQRFLMPLLQELGFGDLETSPGVDIDGKLYPISHMWAGSVPLHLVGARVSIGHRTPGVAGAAQTSPHGLVQEFLNRSDAHLWAMVSNGRLLRLLRDNASLTRQAYVEFDLAAIFGGEQYSDFVVLWLTCHRTRFAGERPEECLLERWSLEAASAGTRALDKLRDGVERAIASLGEGFLKRPNTVLKQRLRSGELTVDDYQRQLLRVIYRLLFLLVAESRDLLLAREAAPAARDAYQRFYSIERLRKLALARRGSAHTDLWEGLAVVMGALSADGGAPGLGLAPLGSFLWSPAAVGDLNGAEIDNRHVLDAVRALTLVRDDDSRIDRPVDYRNMGAEELGSIYESLLELHAEIDVDAAECVLSTAAGNERKTTGSYYTPTALIVELLDSALDPVLAEAAAQPDPEAAILSMKVLDPAVGSGHFLIAAANRIAYRLAAVRCGDVEPAPEEVRHALRDVVGKCLYGVDINPMAVELCKVSLWLEAMEPGMPLSFLDHRIACGNSLLGTVPRLLADGIPDAAFKALTGDDKAWCTTLRKSNKADRKNRSQGMLSFGSGVAADAAVLAEATADLDAIDDVTTAGVKAKEARWSELRGSDAAARSLLAANAWCAAFVCPKSKGDPVLTDSVLRKCLNDSVTLDPDVRRMIAQTTDLYGFLHLHLAFPDVFTVPDDPDDADNANCGWSGGFDVVLGNPPWERVKLQEKEWFATRAPDIAGAPNAAARKRLIAALEEEDPPLHRAFRAAVRRAEGESALLRNSDHFPLGGRGDVNTYVVFAELMRDAISPTGRMGVIVPSGIATDDTTKYLFSDLVNRHSLVSLFDFENRKPFFPGVHRSYKFCLLTLTGDRRPVDEAEFVFFALETGDLADPEKRFTLSPDDFALLNPNTRTCPVFRTRRDAEITKGIYRRVPVLVKEGDPDGNPWDVYYLRLVHYGDHADKLMTTCLDSSAMRIYEGKMIHQFNHRWADWSASSATPATTEVAKMPERLLCDPSVILTPRYWMTQSDFHAIADKYNYQPRWFLAYRDVARSTDARTAIASAIPMVPASVNAPILGVPRAASGVLLLGILNSFAFDFVARQSVGGIHLTFGVLKQLAVITPAAVDSECDSDGRPVAEWIHVRILELTYTAWDMEGFAADHGYHGPPFRWDPERRALLRAELDALMFWLYGIDRNDVDYILDTFPIVKRKDEAEFGEYRTKRLILERYDAMTAAEAAGLDYETALDPPPADPSLAHPESTRPAWATPIEHDGAS